MTAQVMTNETPEATLPIEPGGGPGTERDAPHLIVVQGKQLGQRLPLTRERTTVGRSAGCDLRLDSPVVSAEHARIVRTKEGFGIEDLGSTNGVTVNGRRLAPEELQPIGHGDTIGISDHVLLFVDRGSFTDLKGLSTIQVDMDRARAEADALVAELGAPPRRSDRS
jgi:pSer/pThr/pTyr-binding forkhead associated (FHA) protein